jgi:hypothetical protein
VKKLALVVMAGVACGAPPPVAPPPDTTTGAPAQAPPGPIAQPTVTLLSQDHANVSGALVTFDGEPEGLAWPSLRNAYAARGKAARAIVAAPRSARMIDVLRVAWTLRDGGVEFQTLGAGNEVRAIVVGDRPSARAEGPTCHAAIFVGSDGGLRVAHPGGSSRVPDLETLLVSLDRSRRTCPIRWIAFGGETPDVFWGAVFDVAVAVDTSHAAQGARFVLGEPKK